MFILLFTKQQHKNLPKKQQNKENILSTKKPTEKQFFSTSLSYCPRTVAAFFACKMHLAIALRFKTLKKRKSLNNCSGSSCCRIDKATKKSLLLLCSFSEVKVSLTKKYTDSDSLSIFWISQWINNVLLVFVFDSFEEIAFLYEAKTLFQLLFCDFGIWSNATW
jgi:hypothetical protein